MNVTYVKALDDLHRAAQDFLGKNGAALGEVIQLLVTTFRSGRKLLLFGNGGSAAQAQHLAAELVNRLRIDRRPWPALALSADTSVLTSIGNDAGYDQVFSRQVEALGRVDDVALALTTSGTSPNILAGVAAARKAGMVTVGLIGQRGGALARECDHCLVVPSEDTARIQEVHLLVGHVICELVERELAR